MKNYFLGGLSPEQIAQLSGVESCELEIDGEEGIVVDQENLIQALKTFGMKVVAETETSIEGIDKVTLAADDSVAKIISPPKAGEVIVDDCSKYRCDHWKSFAQNIQTWIQEQKFSANTRLVFLGESAYSPEIKKQAEELLIIIQLGERIMPPELLERKEKNILAVCKPGSFLIRIDGLPDCPERPDIPQKLLKEFIPWAIEQNQQKIADFVKIRAEERRNASREAYIKECSRRFEKTLTGTQEKISQGHITINNMQKDLVKLIREVHGAERKLEQLSACKGTELERYAKEFESLAKVPGVEDVQVADGVIKVFTEHIYITPDGYPNDTFDIGKFRIEIYTSGSNGGIKFFNLTRQGTGKDYNTNHPHVQTNGTPCLGNIKEQVASLIGEYEYSAVAQLGIQYLEEVNLEDSAGKNIFNCWPRKEKGE